MAGMNLKALQQFIAAQQAMEDGLVSFKAGRMDFDSTSRMVTAEKTPGKVKLVRDDSGLIHFNWQSRLSGETKLDVMLFPGSAVWERVKECTDGRVYVLRMIDGGRKHFFWMQEPKEEKDEELAEKVSKFCKGDSSGGASAAAGGGGLGGLSGLGGFGGGGADPYQAQLQRALAESARAAAGGASGGGSAFGGGAGSGAGGAPDINQLFMNALTGRTGGGTAATPAGGGSAMGGAGGQEALARALAAAMLGGAAPRTGPTQEEIAALREQLAREPRLTDILDPSKNAEIAAIIDDDEKVAEALKQHLPEEIESADDILSQMESPEFRSALKRLEAVLNSPDIQAIMTQMGLKFNSKIGVGAFIAAIIERHGSAESSAAAASGDGDAEMTDKTEDKTS